MKEFEVFIFGIVNFAILISLLFWGTRKLARQFFYARRMNIKKDLVDSARLERSAKFRLKNSKKLFENLQSDLAKRRAAAAAVCNEECRAIEDGAKRVAQHLIDGAVKQGRRERERALEAVKQRVMEEAFCGALEFVKAKMNTETGRAIMDKEIDRFENAISKEMRPAGQI